MKFKKSVYSYIMMLGHLCADLGGGALPAILPFLIAQKGITYTQAAGLTFALSSIGSVIQPVFGSMADKTSRPWLMSLGIFMAGCGISMLGFIDNYWLMFVAVAFTGIGSALFHPDGGRMANYVSGVKKGKGISLFSVGGNMGGAIGPMLAVFGITMLGGDLKGAAILAIPAFAMAAFMVTQHGNLAEFAAEGNKKTKAAIAAGQKDDWGAFGKLTLVVFLRSTLSMGMTTFIPLFWMSVLMQSEEVSGSVTTIISLSGAVATLIGGNLADKYGFNKTIRAGLVLMIPCLIAVTMSRNVLLCTFMLVPTAVFLNFAFSPSVALGQKFIPNHIGLASGITMGLASSFGGVVSPLLGKVADNTSIPVVMWILVAIAVAACVFSFFVPDAPPEVAAE
ncbi:MAG: MFS transporter [Lachnospiraceae bacterium]|nr:MFS transporter [Lachnospiraceae bacterium]